MHWGRGLLQEGAPARGLGRPREWAWGLLGQRILWSQDLGVISRRRGPHELLAHGAGPAEGPWAVPTGWGCYEEEDEISCFESRAYAVPGTQ